MNDKNKKELARQIGTIAVGHTAKKIEEYLFDWLLYGTVVYYCTQRWGSVWGSVYAFCIMAPLSAWLCEWYIKFYDWAGVDWLGFEALKEIRDIEHGNWFARLTGKIMRFGSVPAFFALCVYGDPFMVTVYFRDRTRVYQGLSGRDYTLFLLAVVISNAYWTLRWTVLIEVATYLWNHFAR